MLLYHCAWLYGSLTDHHKLCLYSLKKTQTAPFQVIIWTVKGYETYIQEYCKTIKVDDFVDVRVFDPLVESHGTPYEGRSGLLFRRGGTLDTDEIRCMVTYKYGGFYFDFDVVWLKDISCLEDREFVYRWSTENFANTAVMHIKKGSWRGKAIMDRMINIGSPYPPHVFTMEFCRSLGFEVMPCELFDLGWMPNCDPKIRMTEFFKPLEDADFNVKDFCPHSYAYHWHNKWDAYIHPESIAGKLFAHFCSDA